MRALGKKTTRPNLSVAHIASGDLWAGAEVQTFNLLKYLSARQGIRCVAVLLNDGELAQRLRDIRIPVHCLKESEHSVGRLLWLIMRILRQFAPDIVHTHRTKENFLGAIAAAITPGVQSVRTVHGSAETAAFGLGSVRKRLIDAIDRQLIFRLQRCAIAVSPPLARDLELTMPADKIIVIRNGVDASEARQAAAQDCQFDLQGQIGIGIAGRLVHVKRIDVFLEAAQLLSHEFPGKYRFYVVGDGPLLARLKRKARVLGVDTDCVFTGFLTNPLPLLSRMSALVMTSDHEGTPMIALESLALGVPVVAYAVGGLVPLITGADQGQLVRSQDPALLAKAIALVATPNPHAHISPRRSLLPVEYTIQFCANAHVSLYRSLLMQGSQHGKES